MLDVRVAEVIRYVRRVPRSGPAAPEAGEVVPATPPPQPVMQPGAAAWLQVVLPVVGTVGALVFVLVNPKPVYIATGLLFAISAVAAGAGLAVQQRISFRHQTRTARARYLEYLGELRERVMATALRQRADAEWRHPEPSALVAVAASRRRLWERRPDDGDFLEVRAGLGVRPLATPLRVDTAPSAMAQYDPVSGDALERLARAHDTVPDLPVTVHLARARIVSIVGPRPAALGLARALVAQVATWQAPSDVRLALCLSPAARDDWEWCKWLPHMHVWDPTMLALAPPPAICSDADGLASALAALPRGDRLESESAAAAGAWIVAAYDAGDPGPGRDQLLRQAMGRRASVLILVTGSEPEPPEVDVRLRVGAGDELEVFVPGSGGLGAARADRLEPNVAEALARRLSPLRLAPEDESRRLIDTIQLDHLLGVDDARKLDLDRLWRPASFGSG